MSLGQYATVFLADSQDIRKLDIILKKIHLPGRQVVLGVHTWLVVKSRTVWDCIRFCQTLGITIKLLLSGRQDTGQKDNEEVDELGKSRTVWDASGSCQTLGITIKFLLYEHQDTGWKDNEEVDKLGKEHSTRTLIVTLNSFSYTANCQKPLQWITNNYSVQWV